MYERIVHRSTQPNLQPPSGCLAHPSDAVGQFAWSRHVEPRVAACNGPFERTVLARLVRKVLERVPRQAVLKRPRISPAAGTGDETDELRQQRRSDTG